VKEHRKMNRDASSHKPAARPTIGMFINGLGGFQQLHWLGAVEAARAHHANLLCFAGKELGNPNPFVVQANTIYDLVSAEQIDGLIIWTTTLQAFVGQQQIAAFCHRYPLPIVSMKQVLPGLPSVVVDDKHGMYQAVSHLIEVHGHRRVAFIRGPEKHPLAQERYQGYLAALEQHGLPFDPTLVAPPLSFWRPDEAAAQVHRLLDARRPGGDRGGERRPGAGGVAGAASAPYSRPWRDGGGRVR
jgi:DNA-binding LacI/PurR family transcriptional regulator